MGDKTCRKCSLETEGKFVEGIGYVILLCVTIDKTLTFSKYML